LERDDLAYFLIAYEISILVSSSFKPESFDPHGVWS